VAKKVSLKRKVIPRIKEENKSYLKLKKLLRYKKTEIKKNNI
tara:strand:- start:1162 stop:1287 length:126 start_codon:yes stop_codon:yes gene_type:complete